MIKRTIVCTGILSTLGFLASCKTSSGSDLKASTNQSIEEKYGANFDLTREIVFPKVADSLTSTRSRIDNRTVGSKLNADLSYTNYVTFTVSGGMEYGDVFESRILNEVVIARIKDEDGTGTGDGVFLDPDTVAADRIINCKSQKVIADSTAFNVNAGAGISFLGLGLSTNASTGQKIAVATDYTMNRGYYRTKNPVKMAEIFDLCADISASDVALQSVDHINEAIQMQFQGSARLEKLANEVAKGRKVNNFQFQNIKFDFQKLRSDDKCVTFTIFPDTGYSDPKLESTVSYHMNGTRAVIDDVKQVCVSNCQNYIDSNGKHGLHGYGEAATVEQSNRYIKLLSTIFAATLLGSK